MRLGGWHRIGIVLSVIFWVGFAGWQRAKQVEFANFLNSFAANRHFSCSQNALAIAPNSAYLEAIQKCDEQHRQARAENIRIKADQIPDLVFFPLILIALGWSFSYLVLFLIRWIRRGFKQH